MGQSRAELVRVTKRIGCSFQPMWHRLYFHVVWTTRDREPLIDARYAVFLSRFLRAVARQERSQILEIGLVGEGLLDYECWTSSPSAGAAVSPHTSTSASVGGDSRLDGRPCGVATPPAAA